MFGIGLPELLVILAILLVVLGPKKLPQAGAAIGKAIGEMRRSFDQASGKDKNNDKEAGAAEKSSGEQV